MLAIVVAKKSREAWVFMAGIVGMNDSGSETSAQTAANGQQGASVLRVRQGREATLRAISILETTPGVNQGCSTLTTHIGISALF
jgi:hypothetical protein